MKAKLQQLQQTLAQGFVGRDELFKSALLGLIAGENILLIGPPGTAKSMLARRISQVLHHDDTPDYFEYLLTKFSTPEEIFGPLSIHELKQDRFQRNITGYLPSVQIGFLDEIFKASSSILNALLTILNERKYHNGTQSLDVPLQSLVAASNELPIGQEELSALYDRFLIRRFVDYVGQNQLDELFDLTPSKQIESSQRLSIADLQQFRKQAEHVVFPAEVKQAILQIKQQFNEVFKENRDEQWSDRRFIKCLHLMRISAITNQRTEVDFSDILLLKDCIWNNPAHQEQVLELIKTELRKYDVLMPINAKNNQSQQNQQKKEKQQNTNKTVSQNVIKGYKGAGTKHDPILIENLNQFIGLQRAEIGQQGYYFKQTADIDCTQINIDSWSSIDFEGHYDGNHHRILFSEKEIGMFTEDVGKGYKTTCFMFIANSSISNLTIKNFALAWKITKTSIINCHVEGNSLLGLGFMDLDEIKPYYYSGGGFFGGLAGVHHYLQSNVENKKVNNRLLTSEDYSAVNAKDSEILHCSASYHIAINIENTKISRCFSNSCLIRFKATGSILENNDIYFNHPICSSNTNIYCESGGVARTLASTIVRHNLVAGEIISNNSLHFYGIAYDGDDTSLIEGCALDIVVKDTNSSIFLESRISATTTSIQHRCNISSDLNKWGTNDTTANGHDGENISESVLTQYFFEHNLGWDFDHIWQWNDTDKRLELQPYRGHATPYSTDEPVAGQQSRLQHQMQNNIWL